MWCPVEYNHCMQIARIVNQNGRYVNSPTQEGALSQGSYALLCSLDGERVITVGRLGVCRFPPGYYLYVGSALGGGGLGARIARHLRREKRLFWHIDYFLAEAAVLEVWEAESRKRAECDWAATALEFAGQIVVSRFGASDCRCPAHLIYWAEAADWAALAARLPGAQRRSVAVWRERDTRWRNRHIGAPPASKGS